MTTPEIKKYQKCEFCHNTFEVAEELKTVKLPYVKYENGILEFTTLSICNPCADKLYDLINEKLRIEDIEYIGVECRWRNNNE